jgi:haloacetate dehalogenase
MSPAAIPFENFTSRTIDLPDLSLFTRFAGDGPPLLLLHGFPETHLMWRGVAPLLAQRFTVVCADLRGYGRSGCPATTPDHAPYSKRTYALDLLALMESFGFQRFAVAGHDRGARVAYRLALDHPGRVERAAVLDIVPTDFAWTRAHADFALGFWPWSLLAQPAPLPEQILSTAAEAIIDHALDHWGSAKNAFPRDVRDAYGQALLSPEHARSICEEYRAAATIDRAHDQVDQASGRKIECPFLVLWSERGPLASWFSADGGPLGVWRKWALNVEGAAIDGGHFFPEEAPVVTAGKLSEFFTVPARE